MDSLKLVWLKSFFLHGLKFWAGVAFQIVAHFPRLDLNQGRDCHKLKDMHSMELALLKSLFLHRLKSSVRDAFLTMDHFSQLHLSQGRDFFGIEKSGL
jgi:hypothetical protein